MKGVLVIAAILCTAGAYAREQATPRAQFEALLRDYKAAWAAYEKRFGEPPFEDDGIPRYLAWPAFEYVPRFLKLAEDHTDDPAAADALLWIVGTAMELDRDFYAAYARSLELLVTHHLRDPRIGRTCLFLAKSSSASREKFLRAVLASRADRETRGRACLGLAESLLDKINFVEAHEARGTWFVPGRFTDFTHKERLGAGFLPYFEGADAAALRGEAAGLFERVGREFAEIRYAPHIKDDYSETTLGAVAKQDLYQLRHLSLGSPAPETAGEDLQGKPLALADYRGKVVVLSFWGTWCGPCMQMVPHERALAKRFEGRPFAIVGVDADEDRGKARKVMDERGMTWRSWWDGRDTDGPISALWNVRGWPTFIVIDHRGVIRYRSMAGSEKTIEAVVDRLVREAERPGGG